MIPAARLPAKKHLEQILEKLGVETITAATEIAFAGCRPMERVRTDAESFGAAGKIAQSGFFFNPTEEVPSVRTMAGGKALQRTVADRKSLDFTASNTTLLPPLQFDPLPQSLIAEFVGMLYSCQ